MNKMTEQLEQIEIDFLKELVQNYMIRHKEFRYNGIELLRRLDKQ